MMAYYINHYVIDWEKVQTLDDIKRLLAVLDVAFEPDTPGLLSIADLVRLEPKPRAQVLR